jgi:hypothetical protein
MKRSVTLPALERRRPNNEMTKFCLGVIISAVLSASLCCCARASQMPPATKQEPSSEAEAGYVVPAEYQQLYASLSTKLDDFDGYLNSHWDGTKSNITFGAELLSANANIGQRLLSEQYYRESVLMYLDGLQAMGVTGVKITVAYPLLTPEFPNYDGYVKFYNRLAQECRARKLKMLVAMGNLFSNTPFSDLKYSLSGLTLAKYREGKRQMAETIIEEMHPDYLSIANEPTAAEYLNTGIRQTPSEFAETARYILTGLDRSGTLIGAGAGTWDDMAYIRELAQNTDLDYIDMHTYPVEYLKEAITAADIATAYNKKLVIAEAWLNKAGENETGGLGTMSALTTLYGRDVYSFWQPLDSKFLEVLVKLANYKNYEFISPFWSTYLFGYIDYDAATKSLPYDELRRRDNMEASKNILSHKLSGSGLAYQKLIANASPK